MKSKKKQKTVNNPLLGIGIVLFYLIASQCTGILFSIYKIDYNSIPIWLRSAYSLTYQIVMLSIIILLLSSILAKNIKDLKKNHNEYFKKYFKYWFLLLGIMMLSNLLIMLFTNSDIAGNEEAIRKTFEVAPIYTFVSAVFIAPILEELVFRQGLRLAIKDNTLFILVSGLVFGGLHVISNITGWTDLLYLIPYSTPGFIFAYLLTKTDNVLVPASMHFMHNGILMSLQVMMMLLG